MILRYPHFTVWVIVIHCFVQVMRQYIAGVIKFCEKKGNEALWKKLDCIKNNVLKMRCPFFGKRLTVRMEKGTSF